MARTFPFEWLLGTAETAAFDNYNALRESMSQEGDKRQVDGFYALSRERLTFYDGAERSRCPRMVSSIKVRKFRDITFLSIQLPALRCSRAGFV